MISHVRNTSLFIEEMDRILKKGGYIYIYDNNNLLNLFTTIRRRLNWKKYETGPVSFEEFGITKTYFEVRKETISEHFPWLKHPELQFLSEKTVGLYGPQIITAVKKYLAIGKISKRAEFKYRNPLTGQYPELDFNPFSLAKKFRSLNYEVEIRPPFYCGRFGDHLYSILRIAFPLSIFLSDGFEIICKKL